MASFIANRKSESVFFHVTIDTSVLQETHRDKHSVFINLNMAALSTACTGFKKYHKPANGLDAVE